MSNQLQKLAYSIADLAQIAGVSRSYLYQEIKSGRLAVRKAGRRSVVLHDSAQGWLESLPTDVRQAADSGR